MKNHKILISLSSLFLFYLNINAQDFETLELIYETDNGLIPSFISNVNIYSSDTVIQGFNCYISENSINEDQIYFRYENDSVLIFDSNTQEFTLMYRYNVQVGDTVDCEVMPIVGYNIDVQNIIITEIDYVFNENSTDSLKRFWFKDIDNQYSNYNNYYIENIGYHLFNNPIFSSSENFYILHCGIVDDEIFNFTEGDCSSVSISSIFSEQENIKTFPNPMFDQVVIDFSNIQYQGSIQIELFDIAGQKHIVRQSHRGVEQVYLDSSKLLKGIYYLSVSGEDGRYLFTKKMMK